MRNTTDHGSASLFSGVRTTTLYGHAVLNLIEHESGIGVDDLQQRLSERPNMKGASALTVPRSYVEDSLDELLQRGWIAPLGAGYVTTGRLDRESVYRPALTDAVYAAVRSAPEGYRINPDDWTGSLGAVYAVSALVEMGAVESRQVGRTPTDTRYFAAEESRL